MIIILAIICFVAMCFMVAIDCEGLAGFCGMAFITCLVVAAFIGGSLVNGRTLNAKIEMYTQENQKIENDINALVEQYLKYESDTYGQLKNESSITLVSLYPELKADALVTKQIEVYISNNEQIKNLKEEVINLSNHKWWLYFGS